MVMKFKPNDMVMCINSELGNNGAIGTVIRFLAEENPIIGGLVWGGCGGGYEVYFPHGVNKEYWDDEVTKFNSCAVKEYYLKLLLDGDLKLEENTNVEDKMPELA